MAGRKHTLYYWDSCLFIAWLTNEQRPDPADLDGIGYVVEEWEKGNAVVVTSTIARIEVLDCDLTADQAALFRKTLERSSLQVAGVTTPIANLAHEIRAHYQGKPGFKVKTPDAIHLATALAMECDAFLTFDGKSPKKRTPKRLLALGPVLAGKYPLKIEPPRRPAPPPPMPPPEPDPQAALFDLTKPAAVLPLPAPAAEAPGEIEPPAKKS